MKTKYKHLTLEDRIDLEEFLTRDSKLNTISDFLRKHTTTISKEVKRNRIFVKRNMFNTRDEFDIRFNSCQRLKRFPHVCNGCPDKKICRRDKYYYRGKDSHLIYERELSFSRTGIDIDPDSFDAIDNILEVGLAKGQTINHILHTYRDVISVTPQTIYRWIDDGYLSVGRLDLQKAVRYKPRRKKRPEPHNKGYREGRTYNDYTQFVLNNPGIDVVQMDTVEGSKSSKKVMLTLLFTRTSLLHISLLKAQNQDEVIKVLNNIEKSIGIDDFKKFFGCILTDNGSEFKNPERIEYSPFTGEQRTHVFYCDPGRSDQKGSIERHHSYIRLFIPKGTCFDEEITQKNLSLMSSHINSVVRPKENNKTPYNETNRYMGHAFLSQLGIVLIEPKKVILKPTIFKK